MKFLLQQTLEFITDNANFLQNHKTMMAQITHRP